MKCMEKAYAKVNLTLQVGSRRPDGYHAVMSVMQRISLWDTVTVERGTGRDTLLCSVPVTENVNDNLCMKAARAFFAETGTKSDGVTITLEKHIPVQAGLGGGSSDDGGKDEPTYTVTIKGVDAATATFLLENYDNATAEQEQG